MRVPSLVALALCAPTSTVGQVYMMGGQDKTDVVYTVHDANGKFLTRHKADLKGGRWTWLMMDGRCPGMVSVWYASNGSERRYFVETGGATEREVSLKASAAARAYAKREGKGWSAGVMRAFRNDNRAVPPPPATTRDKVEAMFRDPCAKRDLGSIGVRG